MKFLIIGLCVAAALATNPDLDEEWQTWKDNNRRKYEPEEEDYRRFVWEYNYKVVTMHNDRYALGRTSYTMAINQYADMTNVEFRKQMNGFVMKNAQSKQTNSSIDVGDLPITVNWITKGFVTAVKNQGQCGSSWAFSATGSLEGQTFRMTGKLPAISEQNLVDCAGAYGCHGCQGGEANMAFYYIRDNNGIDSESSYPYVASNQRCRFNPANVVATDRGFVNVRSMDERALQRAVATIGPVSVAIDSNHNSFKLYASGIYYEPNCSQTRLDHAALVVGYGTYNGHPYWLVKNSWGVNWGLNGYIMMSRFKNNQCGIASMASYPLV